MAERTDRSIFGQGKVHLTMLNQVKPFMIAFLKLMIKLPEPTKQNTILANSHMLIDLRDEFFLHENGPRNQELKALWNIFIAVYDYDMYYRERIDWSLRQIMRVTWRSSDGRREPRRPWWGKNVEVCPKCGQDKGGPKVFADCPSDMHSN